MIYSLTRQYKQMQLLVILALLCMIIYGLRSDYRTSTPDLTQRMPEFGAPMALRTTLQIIAVRYGTTDPVYVTRLFDSIYNSSGFARLLLVSRDNGSGCHNFDRDLRANIQAICLSDEKFSDLVAEYLCKHWRCNESTHEIILHQIHQNVKESNTYEHWRPLYGAIFADFLLPYSYIAWSDIELSFGALSELPRYVFDGTFDVVTFDAGGHDAAYAYLRPQFTAFRDNDQSRSIWQTLPEFATPSSFIENAQRSMAQPHYWSSAYFVYSDLNWIQLRNALINNTISEQLVKTIQHKSRIIQVPLAMNRAETLRSLDDAISPYPATLEDSALRALAYTEDCDAIPPQVLTRQCFDTNQDDEAAFVARLDMRLLKSAQHIAQQGSVYRRYLQSLPAVSRRPWFRVPNRLARDEVYEYSDEHFVLWDRNTGRIIRCATASKDADQPCKDSS